MKKTFVTGLATLLPIAITFFILRFIVDLLTTPFLSLAEQGLQLFSPVFSLKNHLLLVGIASKILILLFLVLLIFLLGIIGEKVFLFFIRKIFFRIPLIKTIYSFIQGLTSVFVKKNQKFFKKTVLLPFPHLRAKVVGLLSGPLSKNISPNTSETLQTVFIPTAPHPISGFLLLIKEEELIETDIKTEEVFKFLVSCGVYDPEPHPPFTEK